MNQLKWLVIICCIFSSCDGGKEYHPVEQDQQKIQSPISQPTGYLGGDQLCGTLQQESLSNVETFPTTHLSFTFEYDDYQRFITRLPSEFDKLLVREKEYQEYLKKLNLKQNNKILLSARTSLGLNPTSKPPFDYAIALNEDGQLELELNILTSKMEEYAALFYGWNYKVVPSSHIDSLMLDICATKDLEFTELYPIVDSIPSHPYEKLVLVTSLKTKGFEVTNWARGNWTGGPRIITFTMSNGRCDCQVDKLYHSTEEKGRFKVTERIKCEG